MRLIEVNLLWCYLIYEDREIVSFVITMFEEHVVHVAGVMLCDWLSAQSEKRNFLINPSLPPVRAIYWSAPQPRYVKCNVDVAITFENRRLMGFGMVIRDGLGEFFFFLQKL